MKKIALLTVLIASLLFPNLNAQSFGEKLGKNLRKGVEKTKEVSKNVYQKSKETSKSVYEKGKETWKNTADDRQKIKEQSKKEGKGFVEGWNKENQKIKKDKNNR